MMIDREARKLLFETVAHRVIASADELTDAVPQGAMLN